jgi:hypothetical protein
MIIISIALVTMLTTARPGSHPAGVAHDDGATAGRLGHASLGPIRRVFAAGQ